MKPLDDLPRDPVALLLAPGDLVSKRAGLRPRHQELVHVLGGELHVRPGAGEQLEDIALARVNADTGAPQ
jgi:hypothetical protein